MIARRYMHEYGITRQQLAQVAVTTRRHASLHPNSHMKNPITVEDVIGSKEIAAPLNILDCCLISDAAGAFIVTSAERARDCKAKPAYLLGVGERHTHEHILCAESLVHFGAGDSGRFAYEMAGLGPEDIDVAQLYDCFSIVPVIELEELGFCKPGEGARSTPNTTRTSAASCRSTRTACFRTRTPAQRGTARHRRSRVPASRRARGAPGGGRGSGAGAQRRRCALVALHRDPRKQPALIDRQGDAHDGQDPRPVGKTSKSGRPSSRPNAPSRQRTS